MLDGRVKTLHPAVHGGILARRHLPDDLAAIGAHGIEPDRPRGREPLSVRPRRRQPGNRLRRADRGDRHRRPEHGAGGGQELPRRPDRRRTRATIRACWRTWPPGGSSPAFRFELSRRAFAHTAAYDATIASRSRRWATRAIRSPGRPRRRPCRRRCACRCRSAACCATARTRTSRRRGTPSSRRRASAPPRSSRARSCPTPTCSTWTPRRASRWSSTSRRRR